MGNTYLALKQKWQKELDDFPIKFAFSKQQFAEAMKALGLIETDTDKVYSVPGGGFIRKTDAEAFRDLFKRRSDSHAEAVAADKDGTGYIFEMFDYELANHEYSYTHDTEPTLDALGLTLEEIEANPVMAAAFAKAKAAQHGN